MNEVLEKWMDIVSSSMGPNAKFIPTLSSGDVVVHEFIDWVQLQRKRVPKQEQPMVQVLLSMLRNHDEDVHDGTKRLFLFLAMIRVCVSVVELKVPRSILLICAVQLCRDVMEWNQKFWVHQKTILSRLKPRWETDLRWMVRLVQNKLHSFSHGILANGDETVGLSFKLMECLLAQEEETETEETVIRVATVRGDHIAGFACEKVDGMVLERPITLSTSSHHGIEEDIVIKNGRIVVYSVGLDENGLIPQQSAEQEMISSGKKILLFHTFERLLEMWKRHKIDIVASQMLMHPVLRHRCLRHGIHTIERLSLRHVNTFCTLCNARKISEIGSALVESDVGVIGEMRRFEICGKRILTARQKHTSSGNRVVTLVVSVPKCFVHVEDLRRCVFRVMSNVRKWCVEFDPMYVGSSGRWIQTAWYSRMKHFADVEIERIFKGIPHSLLHGVKHFVHCVSDRMMSMARARVRVEDGEWSDEHERTSQAWKYFAIDDPTLTSSEEYHDKLESFIIESDSSNDWESFSSLQSILRSVMNSLHILLPFSGVAIEKT